MMRRFGLFLVFITLPVGLLFSQNSSVASKTEPGFSIDAIDKSVDPCVDFYQYACGKWMKNTEIPPDQSAWVSFTELYERNLITLRDILEKTSADNPGRSSIEQKIGDYYSACMSAPTGITLATLTKDIRLEWRSKDAINSMLFFALLVVVVFSFSFDPNAEESRVIAGGLVWVAFLFAAVVALNQTWARELRNQVLDAYRVSPAPANSLFLAKAMLS